MSLLRVDCFSGYVRAASLISLRQAIAQVGCTKSRVGGKVGIKERIFPMKSHSLIFR